MKVFLAEPNNRYDLRSVEAYGEIKYISTNSLNPFNTEDCLKIFAIGLLEFDPTEDYICMTGNLQIVALMMMIAYNKFKIFRVLIFDARTSNYKERVITHV